MTEPYELSVAEAASQIRDRRLSAVELMESLLARSRALEPSLGVWVTLDEDAALAAARRAQDEMDRDGPAGPLHGVPIGVKDIFYTRDLKTTGCSPIYADFVPDFDATAVALLRRAGAIVMGKTVTTQFACLDPPPTRNPWGAAHTPGGSSSGSAVGVAARMFPAALGSQTAGSVLRPASYNGVVGMKPSFGRISRYGVMPVAWSLDTMGFFCRTVQDAAVMLTCLAEHDPKDPVSVPAPAFDLVQRLGAEAAPPRIAVPRRFFYEKADGDVRERTDAVVESLAASGASVEEIGLEADFDALAAAHRTVMSVEAAAVHERDFSARANDYAPKVRGLIESGMLVPAVSYVRAQRVRGAFRREMDQAMRGFDAVLSPTTTAPAPRDLTTTGDPVFQIPWTTCGFPAITIPSGLGASGLPLGIQLASAPFEEETLLRTASWCERVLALTLAPEL